MKKLLSEKERFLIADAIGRASHEQLWHITKKVPSDFQPWGKRDREGPQKAGNKIYSHKSNLEASAAIGECAGILRVREQDW